MQDETLFLQSPEIARRAIRAGESKSLGDLTDRRRDAVLGQKFPHEIQDPLLTDSGLAFWSSVQYRRHGQFSIAAWVAWFIA